LVRKLFQVGSGSGIIVAAEELTAPIKGTEGVFTVDWQAENFWGSTEKAGLSGLGLGKIARKTVSRQFKHGVAHGNAFSLQPLNW
jgi:hypothetical protein